MPALALPAPPWIVGHRGVRGELPENTVESVLEAVRQKADMVEIDLQLTADGRLIVHHDRVVRVADGESKPVGLATLEEIQECRQVRLYGAEELVYRIPTLQRVLEAAPVELLLNLEIKRHQPALNPTELIDLLAEAIAGRPGVLVSSFDWAILRQIHRSHPDMPLAPLGRSTTDWTEIVEIARELEAFSIHIHRDLAEELGGKGLLDEPAARERPILAYTVNRLRQAERLLRLGVEGLFSDRPGELRERLAGRR